MTLFFQQPEPLRADLHAHTKLSSQGRYRFAHGTNAIPLAADELALAQAHYPIVFTPGDDPAPVAVVGLRDNENLFIEADGAWRTGCYVPAYVRRYPFGLLGVGDTERRILAIEPKAESLSTETGAPLFDGSQPSVVTKRALDFCTAFSKQQRIAAAFARALIEAGLLIERGVEWRRGSDGPAHRFGGFRIVDEALFNALPEATLIDWRACGFLPLVYAHIFSIRRFAALTALIKASEANPIPGNAADGPQAADIGEHAA